MSAPLLEVLRRNALRALSSGDCDDAAALIARLKERDPLSAPTGCLELELHLRRGQIASARAMAAHLIRAHPGSPRTRFLAGWAAYRDRAWTEAETHLRESLHLHPNWRSRWWLGKTLTALRRFDEAEALLVDIVRQRPFLAGDLAWLHECRGHPERALEILERHRDALHGSDAAATQLRRLRAASSSPTELLEEVAVLRELGEDIDDDTLPSALVAMLDTGRTAEARELVAERRPGLSPRAANQAGWAVYRRQAWDLAYDLFAIALPEQRSNVKFLAAFERSALHAGKTADLLERYALHATHDKRLYGRIKGIEKRRDR